MYHVYTWWPLLTGEGIIPWNSTWVLGTKSRSSARATCALNCCAVFPTLKMEILKLTEPGNNQGEGLDYYSGDKQVMGDGEMGEL